MRVYVSRMNDNSELQWLTSDNVTLAYPLASVDKSFGLAYKAEENRRMPRTLRQMVNLNRPGSPFNNNDSKGTAPDGAQKLLYTEPSSCNL